MMLFSGQFT